MIKEFLIRQKKDIQIKGYSYILVKITRKIRNIFYLIVLAIYLPIFIAAAILRVFFKFRIGLINSKRIGHLAINTTLYCLVENFYKKKKLFKKNHDLLIYNKPISNKYLFDKFNEIIKIRNPLLIRPLYDLISFFAKKNKIFKKLLVPRFASNVFKKHGAHDRHDLVMKSEVLLSFSSKDKEKGEKLLEKMGIKNNKYVCLLIRDENYLENRFPNEIWDYHNHRNFEIDDFNEMINQITQRGYFVIRMGRDVKKKISLKNSKVIDYPFSQFVSDFSDIYLMANCELCISTSTGAECVSRIFKKTVAQISPTIGYMYTNKNIINCMLNVNCKDSNKNLKIDEIVKKGLFYANTSEDYKSRNVEIIKNDKDYFKNYIDFCLDIIEGKINKEKVFIEQKSFRDKFQKFRKKGYKFNSTIYLKNNNYFD